MATEQVLTHDEQVYDITIIGGGPTGLFAAFYCGMRNATCKIIDALPELGGQLATLYPEKYIYDVGGFPKIRSRDLVEQLKEQAFSHSQPAVDLNERVEGLYRRDDGVFELTTDKQVHLSRAILICGGIGVFTPKPLPGEGSERFPHNISYFIDNLDRFRNKNVLVVGGGDSAVDFALMLENVAQRVILIHRRDQFRAHEESVKQLQASKVDIRLFHELQSLSGRARLESATLIENKTKLTEEILIDEVVSGLGFSAALGPINEWGLEIDNNEIVVNTKMETNVPGVYAAGDIVTYPGKVKLIATGFGEAPTAVNNAKTFIDPKARLSPGHSSSRKE